MNRRYNREVKARIAAIAVAILISILFMNCNDNSNKHSNTTNDSVYCGIDSAYIVDSLHQTYDEVKVDTQGHVYHVTIDKQH
jgi:hypothetical protein